jgi:hypothetical protein
VNSVSNSTAVDKVGTRASASMRRAELQARCEAQRTILAGHVTDIEQRLQGTDSVLGSIRNVLTKPTVMAGGLALLMTVGRSGWWSKLSRAVVLLTTARRVYQTFRHK